MKKRQEKGGMWILIFVGICIFLLFLLNYKARQNPSLASYENSIEETTVVSGETDELQAERDQLWILFDNLKFTRHNMQPKILFYALILILYIILIGPVAYFLLKKLDKMSWMWVYIPILSVLFSAVILGVNAGTKVTKPIVDTLAVLSPQQDNVVYVASTSPGKQSYELVFGTEVKKILPLYMGGEYELYEDDIVKKSRPYTILNEKNRKILCLNPRTAFTRDYFKLDLEKKEEKELEIKIKPEGKILKGNIVNHTDYEYSYVLVYYQEQYCLFETVKKNDTIELKKQNWKSIYHQGTVSISGGKKKKGDVNRLFTFAYEKYLIDAEPDIVYVMGILPEYNKVMQKEGKNLVSKGLFYQWKNLYQ